MVANDEHQFLFFFSKQKEKKVPAARFVVVSFFFRLYRIIKRHSLGHFRSCRLISSSCIIERREVAPRGDGSKGDDIVDVGVGDIFIGVNSNRRRRRRPSPPFPPCRCYWCCCCSSRWSISRNSRIKSTRRATLGPTRRHSDSDSSPRTSEKEREKKRRRRRNFRPLSFSSRRSRRKKNVSFFFRFPFFFLFFSLSTLSICKKKEKTFLSLPLPFFPVSVRISHACGKQTRMSHLVVSHPRLNRNDEARRIKKKNGIVAFVRRRWRRRRRRPPPRRNTRREKTSALVSFCCFFLCLVIDQHANFTIVQSFIFRLRNEKSSSRVEMRQRKQEPILTRNVVVVKIEQHERKTNKQATSSVRPARVGRQSSLRVEANKKVVKKTQVSQRWSFWSGECKEEFGSFFLLPPLSNAARVYFSFLFAPRPPPALTHVQKKN